MFFAHTQIEREGEQTQIVSLFQPVGVVEQSKYTFAIDAIN